MNKTALSALMVLASIAGPAFADEKVVIYCNKNLMVDDYGNVLYQRYFWLQNGRLTPKDEPKRHTVLAAPTAVKFFKNGYSAIPSSTSDTKPDYDLLGWFNYHNTRLSLKNPTDSNIAATFDIFFHADAKITKPAFTVLATKSGKINSVGTKFGENGSSGNYEYQAKWDKLPTDIASAPFAIALYIGTDLVETLDFDFSKMNYKALYAEEAKKIKTAKNLTIDESTQKLTGLPECK